MEERAQVVESLLKVLANKNRLLILCELIKGSMTVGDIAKGVNGISQSALSQHLALLKAHGIVEAKKTGQNVIYTIADSRVLVILNVLKQYYCSPE